MPLDNTSLPAVPTGCDLQQHNGEPVFAEPWQARSFAMAVQLNEVGLFTWQEWADELSQHIATIEQSDTIRDATGYYRAWQTSLESLVNKKLAQQSP